MISCFMVLKNAQKTGYPFVESIAASLPICDEFLISEGYSTDNTYKILQKISDLNSKVKVIRQEWPMTKNYSAIAEITNAIRTKCSYEYIFSIQANEIIHEETVKSIKALPEIFPNVHTFSFPFLHFVNSYKFYEDFRLRFAKNFNHIQAVGDAWTMGSSKSFKNSRILKSFIHPRKFQEYIYKGIEYTFANSCVDSLSRAIYLKKPVFRYWSLFPINYIEKCKSHAEMFGLNELKKDAEILKIYLEEPSLFWKKAAEIRRKELNIHYSNELGAINVEDHPKLMKDLLLHPNLQSYQVREEVLESMKNL